MRCWLCLVVASVAAALIWAGPQEVWAKPPAKKRARIAAKAKPAKAGAASVKGQRVTPSASDAAASGPVIAENGVKAKVYNFNAMDIDGKLKAPQLLYFLNRVKGEFDESSLDRRSFMPELDRTATDPNL